MVRETAGTSRNPRGPAPRSPARAGGGEAVRRSSLGLSAALLIQYALGLWVSMYVTVPARDQGGGLLRGRPGPGQRAGRAGRARRARPGPAAGLDRPRGPGRVARTAPPSSRSPRRSACSPCSARRAPAAAFVNAGQDGASLGMGLLTAVALLCQVINLFRLSAPPPSLSCPDADPRRGPRSGGILPPDHGLSVSRPVFRIRLTALSRPPRSPATPHPRRHTGRPTGHSSGTRRPGSGRSRPTGAPRPGS